MTAETVTDVTTDQNVPVDTDDLDEFSSDFFGSKVEKEEVKEVEDAPKPEAKPTEADDDDPVDDEAEIEEDSKEEAPKKKKSAQERISELTAARKKAEQHAEELERKLNEALGKKDNPEPAKVEAKSAEPSPDEVDEDGEPKYPLGEFDPKYIRDLTKFTLNEERKAQQEEFKKEAAKNQAEAAQNELLSEWENRVQEVESELPDFRTKTVNLEEAFSEIEPAYGQYLASTIMSLENGPQVLYHLANNIEEAKAIVKLGPVMATIALGKIEASLSKEERKVNQSDAPPPPPRNRGGSVTNRTRGDTEDLEAFEKEFFKKR